MARLTSSLLNKRQTLLLLLLELDVAELDPIDPESLSPDSELDPSIRSVA
jgi:hypothetical protein